MIEAVATALLESGSLTVDQVGTICDSIEEGENWRTQLDVLRQMEEYHRRSMEQQQAERSAAEDEKLTADQKARLLAHFKEIQDYQRGDGLESDGPRYRGEE